jgi:hypothetical protein
MNCLRSHVFLLSVLCFCGENILTEEATDCHPLNP